jgi:hypothetical protein
MNTEVLCAADKTSQDHRGSNHHACQQVVSAHLKPCHPKSEEYRSTHLHYCTGTTTFYPAARQLPCQQQGQTGMLVLLQFTRPNSACDKILSCCNAQFKTDLPAELISAQQMSPYSATAI